MKRPVHLILAAAAAALALVATTTSALAHPTHDGTGKEAGFDLVREDVSPGGVPQERQSDVRCEDGMAGIFPCHKVDLKSFLPLSEFDSIWPTMSGAGPTRRPTATTCWPSCSRAPRSSTSPT